MPYQFAGGYFVPSDTPVAHFIRNLHERARLALGIDDGVTHFEVLYDGKSLRVGEMAVRPGGLGIPRSWQHAFGIDLWDAFVGTQLNEPGPAPGIVSSTEGLFGRTQLPDLPGVRERALAHPGVIEVLPPDESLTGNNEVQFAAPDERSLIATVVDLHRLGGRSDPRAAADQLHASPQPMGK